jgi:hypothetical protein
VTALRAVDVPVTVRLVLDDRTRAALVALGWTPPPRSPDVDMETFAEAVRAGEVPDVLPPDEGSR